MFKEYMTGALTPEVQAVLKASQDIASGVFSLQEAANFYKVPAKSIVQFMTESAEYDVIFNKRET